MYDHMYQRGYVKNIPGAPMCGCVEQMPTVSRSDCTQVDLTESVKIQYDGSAFVGKLTRVHVDFNACQGINNRNNDLWAYMARLYYQEDITPEQFGEAGKIITDRGCHEATRYHLNEMGLTRGYDHAIANWTKVAGRDDLYDGHPLGREAFNTAFFEHSLTKPSPDHDPNTPFPTGQTPIIMRICPDCRDTHKYVFYRRLTAISNPNFDLLNNILYHRNTGDGDNVWNQDFTLHSTYDDAKTGANPWKCPNDSFNYGAPFVGNCSPEGNKVSNQYSIWNWFPGPQGDVAYYVNKPEGEGIAELDLSSSLRFSNLHTSVDLGTVSIPGRVFETDDGAIHVSASGWDIWNRNDQGHYLSEPRMGDVDVKVHVSGFTGIVDGWAKAGIMLRSDNADDSTHAFGYLSGNQGVAMQSRRSKGNSAYAASGSHVKNSPVQTSAWIRLVKKMDTVEFYLSENGSDWTKQSEVEVRFPDDTYRVGLAVTSHHDHYVSEAIFEEYSIEEYNFPTAAPSLSLSPTAWDADVEIGGAKDGQVSYNVDTAVTSYLGYGTGIWENSDSFFFASSSQKDASGAFDVVVYTNEFHTGYQQAKGGIMIRDSNDAGAAHAFIGMKGYYEGVTFISRASNGANTDHHQTIFVPSHKAWIKLSKPADSGTITASYKINEEDEWTEIGSTDVTFTGSVVHVGTAVTAGEPSGNGAVWLKTKDFEVVDATPGRKKLLRA
jgi:regulation of enolase protein 1 (concanavalin A-like superfamily)